MRKIVFYILTLCIMMSVSSLTYADDIVRTDTIDGKPVYYTEEDLKEDSLLRTLYPPVIACKADSSILEPMVPPVIQAVLSSTVDNSYVPNHVEPSTYCEAGGEIEIQSGVSPTGAKTYNIPINVYPGINGCKPELSLSYTSQGGKGPLGVGWTLVGMSAICRGGKSLYYDNDVSSIVFNNSDSFTLDGIRLIKLSDTEYQSETGNIKVIAYMGGSLIRYFEVFYPDGRKGTYGYVNNTTPYRISYPLTQVTDLYGNAINYTYKYADNYYRIEQISYGDVTVDFSYTQSRSDSTVAYVNGQKIFEDNLLKTISCKYNGTTVSEYSLYYSMSNYNNLLTSVGYRGCYGSASPLKFYYGEGSKDFTYETTKTQLSEWYESDNPNMIRVVRGRFNYFGDTDGLIVFPNKNPYFHRVRHSTAFRHTQNQIENQYEGDEKIFLYSGLTNNNTVLPNLSLVTGTGFIDMLCADLTGSQEDCIIKINDYVDNGKDKLVFTVYKSNGVTGLAKAYERTYTFDTAYKDPDDRWSIQPKHFFSGDFDGDGKSEILAVCAYSPLGSNTNMPAKVYVFDLENNSIKYNAPLFTFNEKFVDKDTTDPMDVTNNSDKVFVTDFDGDGRTDICHVCNSGLYLYRLTKAGSSYTGVSAGSFNKITKSTLENRDIMPADVNGDGLVDIIVSPLQTEYDYKWNFWLSKGNGTFDALSFDGPNVKKNSSYALSNYAMLQDVNGDGMADIIGYGKTSFNTHLVNMSKKKGYCNVTFENELSKLVPVDMHSHNRYTQLLSFYKGVVTKYHSTVFDRKDCLLTGMANSLGNVEKVAYDFLDSRSYGVYTCSYINKYPYIVLKENISVVSGADQYMNGSVYDHQNYTYKNAIFHKQGLGFRGFEQISCYDKKNQITQTTYDPYSFSLVKTQTSPTQELSNTYSVSIATNKTAKINLTGRTVKDKLQNITQTTTCSYDSYGYPLTSEDTYSDGATSTTTYTYKHYTATSSLYKLGTEVYRTIVATRNGDTYTEQYYTPVFNSLGLPIVELKRKDGNQVHERHFTYDTNGNVTKQDDRPYSANSSLSETYEYDTSGRLVKKTDHLGLSTTYSYNTYGQLSSSVDKYGKTTTYSYDGLGRKTSTRYPDGTTSTTKYEWTTAGTNGLYAVTESDTGKPTSKTVYDALNREVRKAVTYFNGTVYNTDKIYDMYGRLEKESYPFNTSASSWNTYSYDIYDRLTKSVVRGITTSYQYSGTSVTSTVDGVSVTKTKDAQGNLTGVTDDTGTLTYNLNADGQPASIVSPTGVTTTFSYDKWRRVTQTDDPSLGETTKTYNTNGTLGSTTDAEGNVTSFSYDSYYRVVSKSTDEQTTNYLYDQYDNVTETSTDNGAKAQFTYDAYGRLSTSTEYAGTNIWLKKDFTYSGGNVSSVKYTSQSGVLTTENYTYTNGYLTEVKLNGTQSIYKLTGVNAYGYPTSENTGNLIHNTGYTAYGQVASIRTAVGSTTMRHQILGYDATKHRLINRLDAVRNITEKFEYDDLDRLTKYGNNTVGYDDNGNITSKSDAGTFSYENTNKPYAVSGLDAIANIPSERQDITYTAFYRPHTITQGRYSAEFTYNGDYDRVKMTVTDNGADYLTRYYLGGCYEQDVKQGVTTERLYLNGDYYDATSVIVKKGSASTLYHLLRDNIGSITHIVDENNNVVQEISYDAWGRMRNPATHELYKIGEEPELLLGRGYTGHEHLQMFGIINMNARLYDPVLGRFLSPDPYVQNTDMSQNFNRYSYCMNSPLMYVDKNGEWIWLIGGLVGGVINWATHGCQFNSEGLAYFGVGALAGIATTLGAPGVAVAAISGFANSIVNQGFTNGWGNINFAQAAFSGFVDGIIARATLNFSTYVSKPVSSLTKDIKSPLLRSFVANEMIGIPSGAFMGGVMAVIDNNPETSFWGGVWNGMKISAFTSGLSAVQSAAQYSKQNKVDFLTGEKKIPKQVHHFATNKNSTFTPQMEEIAKKYDLDLDGDWNKERLPHQGRHPNNYHRWVLNQMNAIDKMPGMNQQMFVEQFRLRVINKVHNNPKMLRKIYWNKQH